MKHSLISLAVLSAFTGIALSAPIVRERREGDVWVRTVIHDDGARTVSKKDKNVKEIVMKTFSARDLLLQQSRFEIDAQGRFLRGQIYDRNNRLLYHCEFMYNSDGRLTEERVSDATGLPVRRLFHQYDRAGRAKHFSLDFRDGRSTGGPIAIDDVKAYSATGERGFQVRPGASQGAQNSGARNAAPRSSSKPKSSGRLNLFKRDSKRKFRIFKKRK